MSEPLPPCPLCGGTDLIKGYYTWSMKHWVQCRTCKVELVVSQTSAAAESAYRYLSEAVSTARAARMDDRLAAAVALAGAVERLEAWLLYDSMRWIDLSKRATGIVRARKRLAPRTRPDVAMVEGTLAAALVALAQGEGE